VKSSTQYELRVLNGAQRGASSILRVGEKIRLGRDFFNDIVLPDASETAAQLLLTDDGALHLTITNEGNCQIDGIPVDVQAHSGKDIPVALYTAVVLGDAQIAVGHLGGTQWANVFDTSNTPQETTSGATVSENSVAGVVENITTALKSTRQRWFHNRIQHLLLGTAAILGIASIGTMSIAWVLSPSSLSPAHRMVQLSSTLDYLEKKQNLKVHDLEIENDHNQLVINGYIEDKAQHKKIQAALALQSPPYSDTTSPPSPILNVWVQDEIKDAIATVYRNHNIVAEVESLLYEEAPGFFLIKTQEPEENVLSAARIEAEKIAGVRQLKTENYPPPLILPAIPAVAREPSQEVVSVVVGASKYILTKDGTRYYEGALLPSGQYVQAIVSINEILLLEKNGETMTLKF